MRLFSKTKPILVIFATAAVLGFGLIGALWAKDGLILVQKDKI